MIEGRPFLYQAIEGTLYLAGERGVEAVQSWPDETTVAFVDGDDNYKPNNSLMRNPVQLIVALSPKGANQKWTKQLGHASSIVKLAINPWSREELMLTGLVLALLSTLN
jgi:hypothetical protein